MTMMWKKWMASVLGLALVLPVAGLASAEDEADNNDRPRAERAADDDDRPAAEDRDARATDEQAPANNARQARSVRVQDNHGGSPSDMPMPIPQQRVQPQPMQHQHYVAQGNCGCGSGRVYYSQNNNGYRAARAGNGYRSYSYQGGNDGVVVAPAPAPVYYGNTYSNGYVGGRYGPIQNGANWDRHHEHDSRNLSGSYGSRASLRSNN